MKKSYTKIAKSRDNWKEKAKQRRNNIKILNQQLERRNAKILHLEAENKRLTNEALNSASSIISPSSIVSINDAMVIRVVCVLLVILGVISFRSVPRILQIISTHICHLSWIPHFSSVINWSLRLGLNRLSPNIS